MNEQYFLQYSCEKKKRLQPAYHSSVKLESWEYDLKNYWLSDKKTSMDFIDFLII